MTVKIAARSGRSRHSARTPRRRKTTPNESTWPQVAERTGDLQRLQAVIDQADLFVTGGVIEKFRTEKVNRFAGQAIFDFYAAGSGSIEVGHIHGEKRVVVADGGAQQHGRLLIQLHGHAREVARFGMEQSELAEAQRLDVAVSQNEPVGQFACRFTGVHRHRPHRRPDPV